MKNKIFVLFVFILLSGCATKNDLLNKKNGNKPETETIAVPSMKEKQNAMLDEDIGTIEINTQTGKNKNLKNTSKENIQNKKNITKNQEPKKTEADNKISSDMNIKELDLKEATVSENKTIHVSISDPGWVIKSIKPNDIINIIKRDDLENNTLFQLKTVYPGKAEIMFLRYDYSKKIIFRQPYMIYIKAGDYQENKNSNDAILDKEDRNQNLKEAIDYFNDKNYQRSDEIFLNLLQDGKNADVIYYYLGLIEKNKKNFDAASDYFKKALSYKDSKFYINSVLELMNIYKEMKKYEDALDLYYSLNLSKIDNSKLEELNLSLADIYFYMNNFNKSKNEYKKFIDKFPDSDSYVKALFYYAYSLENLGTNPDFKEAYKIYQQITEDYPATGYYELSKNRIMFLDRHYFKIK